MKKSKPKPNMWYTVYRFDDPLPLCSGTAKECAQYLGMSREVFHQTISKIKAGKNNRYVIVCEDTNTGRSVVFGDRNRKRTNKNMEER